MDIEEQKSKIIAINTRLLLKNKLEGIGWFEYHLLKRITQNHPEHKFYFIFDRPYDESFIFADNITPIVVSPPARHPVLWYIWYELSIPRVLKKINADIFISLDAYTSIRAKCKKLTAIHDIAFVHFDNHMDRWTQKFMRYFTPKYIETSDALIAVSEATKQDIIKTYHTKKEITVVHNAPSPEYKPVTEEEKIEFKKTHTDGQDYFLYIGSIHPRKNVISLLRAFERYKTIYPSDQKLVIIGRKAWMYEQVMEYLGEMKHKKDVIEIPHSTPEEVASWMASALSLVFMSNYEGFGIPLVEAMACHTPIICSDVSSFPEIAGDAALYSSPTDIDSIAENMNTMATDTQLRNQLIENGTRQLKNYNWDKSAKILWGAILEVMN